MVAKLDRQAGAARTVGLGTGRPSLTSGGAGNAYDPFQL